MKRLTEADLARIMNECSPTQEEVEMLVATADGLRIVLDGIEAIVDSDMPSGEVRLGLLELLVTLGRR